MTPRAVRLDQRQTVPEHHDAPATPGPESDIPPHGRNALATDLLEIDEAYDRLGVLHLVVTGELDIATGEAVRKRMCALRASATPVVLDLSAISFIDCSGLRMILEEVNAAEVAGSRLQIAFDGSVSFKRLLRLVHAAGRSDQVPARWLSRSDTDDEDGRGDR